MNSPDMNHGAARPFWAVWLVLFAGLVVLITAAFLLDSQFRSRIGIQSGAVVNTGSAPGAAAAASNLVPSAAVDSTSSASASLAAGMHPADMTSATSHEVQAAYLHYWDIYSDAMLRLDPSSVPEVATGKELGEIQAEVEKFRARNQAVRVVVTHQFLVFDVSESQAKVYDEISNRSFTVDPLTQQPPQGSAETDVEKDTFFFQKIGGAWKVTNSVRDRSGN